MVSNAVLKAWAVHLYTACGAVIGFVALQAVVGGDYRVAFACMALANAIDATDGTLARRFRVKAVLPEFDGARLDDIVDYLNYVVVPLVLAYHAGLIAPGAAGIAVCSLPLLASGYGFCQIDAKTEDHFFKGFPSYWDVVVFYMYTLATPQWFNVAAFLAFGIAVFVPIRYLYPSKNKTLQRTTYVLAALWALSLVLVLAQFPHPSRALAAASLFFPVYYFAISFHLHFRQP